MKRIITVEGRIGRYNVPSFTYADNKTLTLQFNVEERKACQYYAVITCGTQEKTVHLNKDTKIDISPEFIRKGGFNPIFVALELRNKEGNEVIVSSNPDDNGFFIEPLKIEKVQGSMTAQGWFFEVETKLTDYLKRLEAVEGTIQKFEDKGVPLPVKNEEGE